MHRIRFLPTSGKCIQTWPRSAPWLCKISTKLKKDVRDFVEKYFLDTPERPKSLDRSTFLEGGLSSARKFFRSVMTGFAGLSGGIAGEPAGARSAGGKRASRNGFHLSGAFCRVRRRFLQRPATAGRSRRDRAPVLQDLISADASVSSDFRMYSSASLSISFFSSSTSGSVSFS